MKKFVIYGLVGVVVIGIAFSVFRKGKAKEETTVVHPADFVQQVSVSGKVVAAQDVDLGFSQGGRISKVYAKVGDVVPAGKLLAEIENGDLRATVLQKQAALETQQAKLESIKQGTRPEELAIAQTTVDNAQSALTQADQVVADAIKDAYTKSDDAIRHKVDQFMTNPSLDPQLIFLTKNIQTARNVEFERLTIQKILTDWQIDNASIIGNDGVLVYAEKAQKNLASVSSLLADAGSVLNEATISPTITQTAVSGYIADIAAARTAVNTAIVNLSAAVGAQKNASASLSSAQKNLLLKKAGSTQADIDAQSAQVKAAQADLANAQAQLAKTLIFSPFAGVVTKMEAKVGQIVSLNTTEASMIGNGSFQVESFVPEVNVSLIKVGDPAKVTLDAYGEDVNFSVKIVSIDPAETLQDGVSTYKAVLQFDSQDPRVKSGMTANALITTEKRENVIAVPQKIVVTKDGQKFVKVKEGETVTERKVETGSVSSLGQIEITSGLKDGDVVVLEETSASNKQAK
ncbi:MAG TPA: efflux RND transporter periplasmic adaptor subunit [Candidatus Udaeobacter sp.]|nr:efflux RND transporter periplasmic adaptor subunit [Candidatus Udaeobacter sp.]